MERRIYGLENEYGSPAPLAASGAQPRRGRPLPVPRVVSWGRSSTCSSNGARLYLDVGSHPEYATPECDDSSTTWWCTTRRGSGSSRACSVDAEQRLAEEGIRGTIYLFKNNTDSAGNSYGCHENYLTSRRDEFGTLRRGAHPVPRQPPDLRRRRQGAADRPRRHVLDEPARRAHLGGRVSSATTRSRPIINTRDEPHADAERYRRLHVIVGDSNMSEYTTFLKVGAACMLRMLEDPGVVLRDMTLENPIRAIREISHDITCRRTVRLANGREVSALDIQREYLDRALRYAETQGFSALEKQALEMWEHCITTIENDPLKLDREVDWVIKHKLIERSASATTCRSATRGCSCSTCSTTTSAADRSPFYKLQDRGLVERMCTDADIETPSRPRRRPPGPASAASSSRRPRNASATTRSTGCT
jgi:proteasome accessory factor A